ncbi:DUF4411 family protein [Oribacterium parvum]|uniref:DUF4411 family protein n=1 Tax=Oribacterium parvum TaxID=1501329 RepID=UPI0028E60BE3|nr:DUF4411 family protein [Oribacterium parvum]
MMEKELFLIDANSLITPYLTFYSFDLAKTFWNQMEWHIQNGSIAILDLVKLEVLKGKDSLKEWMENIEVGQLIDHREPAIIVKYGEVLRHIQDNPAYKPAALTEWSREDVADPWLIASAVVGNYTIISFEIANKGLNTHNPSKNAKIPDVAKVFKVEVQNLYYMMRVLKFSL